MLRLSRRHQPHQVQEFLQYSFLLHFRHIGYALSEIRKILRDVDMNLSDSTKILYGGSVTEKNIAEILALDEVDGALIGGASLDPKSFSKICRIAKTI
jgi:triosephosphate isomerase